MSERSADQSRRYRLRGRVGQSERRWTLSEGRAGIGSLRGNEIVLPVRGVSRHHAFVSMSGSEILIEDLGSRNGVRVNGTRVQRSLLRPDDEVGIGPVTLRLELVEAPDVDLALSFSDATDAEDATSGGATTASTEAAVASGASWVALLRGAMAHLCVRPQPDLSGALGVIARELPAAGIVVVEWSRGDQPLVLSARGELVGRPLEDEARALLRGVDGSSRSAGVRTAYQDGERPLSCSIAVGRGDERIGLLVIGDFPGRSQSGPLLELLVDLVAVLRPRQLHLPEPHHPTPEGLVFPAGYVVGSSPGMTTLYAEMVPLGRGDAPVLILGETGVGKEHVAKTLHLSSTRSAGPFVAVNCAAIPTDLLEAELFGIGKGVATGVSERSGQFRLAQGGTLFLDEIGEMPAGLQAKLLRALEEKEVQPVGSSPIAVDLRIVTATNTDLHKRMAEGGFRQDLFYRIAGYTLRLLPLRQRREDIPALVESFVSSFAESSGRRPKGVTVKGLRALTEYDWPGNVRELRHEVRQLVFKCPDGEAIDSGMLSEHVMVPHAVPAGDASPSSLELRPSVQRLEARLIRQALARTGGNRAQAARLLGLSRNGLALKLQSLGIQVS